METFQFKKNNFDLIRLIAALQVVFIHGYEHFKLEITPWLIKFLSAFPGVPIFFVTSGFLISASLERSTSLQIYAKNRFLRIYPALWACFFFSLTTVFIFFTPIFSFYDFSTWLIAQLSIGQFYNPDFLREYGVGVLNGSLWTIPVELQFYIFLPILYALLNKCKWNKQILFVAIITLISVNQFYVSSLSAEKSLAIKLIGVSVLPYLYIFMIGVCLQKNLWFVKKYLSNNFKYLFAIYIFAVYISYLVGLNHSGNNLNPFLTIALSFLTLSAAYSKVGHYGNLLKGNDISYGVYIYHMIFVNVLLHGFSFSPILNLTLMIIITILTAIISWKFIEKPALSLKTFSIRNIRDYKYIK